MHKPALSLKKKNHSILGSIMITLKYDKCNANWRKFLKQRTESVNTKAIYKNMALYNATVDLRAFEMQCFLFVF